MGRAERAGPFAVYNVTRPGGSRSSLRLRDPAGSGRGEGMARAQHIVGIDLGTTNCAVAYVDTRGRERPAADLKLFEVPQLVAAGEAQARPMLPSFPYLPGPHELPEGAARLPWDERPDRIVGEFARAQGARVPGHLVASAK